MRAAALIVFLGLVAAPAAAQSVKPLQPLAIRAFVDVTAEMFAAKQTFTAVFGSATQPLFGGGVQVTIRDQFYAEVSASRFERTGSRVVVDNGQVFSLKIPLRATMMPVEITGGFRFRLLRRRRPITWLRPYAGAGVGWYSYTETCTAAAATCSAIDGDFSGTHAGFVLNAGAEFRVHKWVGLSADVEYSHVNGIIGQDGVSKAFNEQDLGGVGGRFRVIVGR